VLWLAVRLIKILMKGAASETVGVQVAAPVMTVEAMQGNQALLVPIEDAAGAVLTGREIAWSTSNAVVMAVFCRGRSDDRRRRLGDHHGHERG
jgi:hypothetical protein